MLREKRSATFDGQRKQHQNTNGLSNGIHVFLIGDPSNILTLGIKYCKYCDTVAAIHTTEQEQISQGAYFQR